MPSWLPLVVGSVLVLQFAGLGAWQVSRGLEKHATQQAYKAESDFAEWQHGDDVRPFQRLRANGHYDTVHQIVLDNIIINSRYGHYVLTPLDIGAGLPVLLVNRGWLEKSAEGIDAALLAAPTASVTVRGRAGSLPKAGYKMGEAFAGPQSWPKHAVYPTHVDIEAALGRPVQKFVLLLEHDEQNGFLRHWVPAEFGPGKHFGYALQWFAMGAVLMGLLIWNYRKKRFEA